MAAKPNRRRKAYTRKFDSLRSQFGLVGAAIEYWYCHHCLPPRPSPFTELLEIYDRGFADLPYPLRRQIGERLKVLLEDAAAGDGMERLGITTYDAWSAVYSAAANEGAPAAKIFALRKLVELCDTFECWQSEASDLIGFLESEPADSPVLAQAVEKFVSAAFTIPQLVAIANSYATQAKPPSRKDLKGLADEADHGKMVAMVGAAFGGTDVGRFERLAWEQIKRRVNTLAGWNEVVRLAEAGTIFEGAFCLKNEVLIAWAKQELKKMAGG